MLKLYLLIYTCLHYFGEEKKTILTLFNVNFIDSDILPDPLQIHACEDA